MVYMIVLMRNNTFSFLLLLFIEYQNVKKKLILIDLDVPFFSILDIFRYSLNFI